MKETGLKCGTESIDDQLVESRSRTANYSGLLSPSERNLLDEYEGVLQKGLGIFFEECCQLATFVRNLSWPHRH